MKGKKHVGERAKSAKPDFYAGGDSDVEKDAEKRKRGGKVEGEGAKKRLDRPCRKNGGVIGADKKPATEAGRAKKPVKVGLIGEASKKP